MDKLSSFIEHGLRLLVTGPTSLISTSIKTFPSRYMFHMKASKDESWNFSINLSEESKVNISFSVLSIDECPLIIDLDVVDESSRGGIFQHQ